MDWLVELRIRKISLSIMVSASLLIADPWHPDITHRPRTLIVSDQIESVQNRLGEAPFNFLWYNTDDNHNSIYTYARKFVEASENTISIPRDYIDERSRVAKNAAFVYLLNRDALGTSFLDSTTDTNNPWARDDYLIHALEYLENLDPSVNGPDGLLDLQEKLPLVNNWQYRDRELIYYCQAYDMLLGAGMQPNTTIENQLEEFANNIIARYSATQYVYKYALQRNNHKIALGSALGVAAVTLNHLDDASNWANVAMILINWVLFADPVEGFDGIRLIDSDGGFAEGPDYTKYTWNTLVPYIMSMKNFKGDWIENYQINIYPGNEYPSANNLALRSPYYDHRYNLIYDFLSNIIMSGGRLPSIEDASLNVYIPEMAILGSNYSWDMFITGSNTPNSIHRLLNKKLGELRPDYISVGNAPGNANAIQNVSGMVIKHVAGSTVFRSVTNTGNEGLYMHLIAKNGLTREASAAHDQADVNHFSISVMGELMVFDAGYPGYNNRYHANKAEHHNTILINGYGAHPPSGPTYNLNITPTPPFIDFSFNVGESSPVDGFYEDEYHGFIYDFVQINSHYGQAYFQRTDLEQIEGQEVWEYDETDSTNIDLKRGVLSIKGIGRDYILIIDQVSSSSYNEYKWLLHTNSEGLTGGVFLPNENGGIINRGSARLQVYISTNDGEIISYETGHHFTSLGLDNQKDHMLLTATKSANDSYFLSIMRPLYETDDSETVFETITDLPNGINGIVAYPMAPDQSKYDIILAQISNSDISLSYHDTQMIETSANFIIINIVENIDSDISTVNGIYGTGAGGNHGNTVTINGQIYNLVYDPEAVVDPEIVVNEFLANSENCCLDSSSEIESFIELYNISAYPINIGGWFLTDSLDDPLKWRVPDLDEAITTIAPGSFITIVPDKDIDQGILHANFNMSSEAGSIGLSSSNGAQVFTFSFEAQGKDSSFGQFPDGSGNWQHMNPTPGAPNTAELSITLEEDLPTVFSLRKNYPNPFNPFTTISYDVPEHAMINITIYDIMGRVVNNLVNSYQRAGYKTVRWNAENNKGDPIAAGLYIYTLTAGKFIQSRKMILLK